LIDVRKLSERGNGFLSNSISIPLNEFQEKLEQLNNNEKNYIHCAGGYRSMIACSILKRNGYKSVVDVKGGFSAIRNSNFQILTNE
jgi:rhodanese-related sulfurtransferase